MGVQDRDWYWKDRDAKARAATSAEQTDEVQRSHQVTPPPLIGADWHWTLKLLVWICIAVLGLALKRLVQ